MNCPKCRTPTLEEIEEAGAHLSQSPFTCSECRGVWVHAEAVPRLQETNGHLPNGGADEVGSDDHAGLDHRAGLCPEGHGILARARVSIAPGFFLDRCEECGYIWFDRGEWERMADTHLLSNLSEFWTETWQRRRVLEQTHDEYLEWARERFGDELFELLAAAAEALREHPARSEAMAFLKEESRKRSYP